MNQMLRLAGLGLVALVLTGCPTTFENTLPPLLTDVATVRDSTTLTSQQKRQRLVDMGLTPEVINGILVDERTANQFGGDLRSAYLKVTNAEFASMTPDEVQLYDDAAGAADATAALNLTDAQAQAIVDVLVTNNIQTKDDMTAFLDNANNVIPAGVPSGSLKTIFVDFDPSKIADKVP
jgi:hypothetical protein